MPDIYNEDEMLSLENDFEVQIQTLDDLDRRTRRVTSEGAIDRMTMESVHRDYPEAIDDNYPLASYTKEPSEQNLSASMESFGVAKSVAVAAAGALLGSIIYMLIKLFRTDGAEARAEKVDEQVKDIREKDKTIKTMVKEARSANLSTADKTLLQSIEENNYREYASDLKLTKTSSQGKIFLDAVSQNGDVFRTLEKWARSIHNHYTSFSARVNTLTEQIGKMYDLEARDVPKFLKDLEESILPPDDPFFEEMGELNDIFQGFMRSSGGEYSSFLAANVMGSFEFYDMASMDDRWPDRVDKISPNGDKQIEKNLDRLEKDAQALVDGKRDAALAAKKARRKTKVDEHGNVELDAIATNLDVERAVKNAELAIRSEVQHLRVYRTTLSRVLYFYQMLSLKSLEMNNHRIKHLREMLNRAQTE
jgi:hypothetical protein